MIANPRWVSCCAPDNSILHDDTLSADLDRSALRDDHGPEQNAAVLANGYVPADSRRRRNRGGFVNARAFALMFKQHSDPLRVGDGFLALNIAGIQRPFG